MTRSGASVEGVGVVVRRLRVRQGEIEEAIFALREMARAQASLLDQLVIGVTREHVAELQRAGRSREHRQLERVRILLAGEHSDAGMVARGVDPELDYDFGGEHLGVIGRGTGARQALGEMAERLDRRLLCVAQGTETEWAWLGGRRPFDMADLVRGLSAVTDHHGQIGEYAEAQGTYLSFAVGEPAKGLDGWRLTHQQAQAALAVALRRPQRLTRYADVALLATALKDEMLARALIDTYLAPLDDHRGGGTVLRETLRVYLAAEQNISSAAASLGVVWNTVKNRLQTIEAMLDRTLHPCSAELEVALQLDELGVSTAAPETSNTG